MRSVLLFAGGAGAEGLRKKDGDSRGRQENHPSAAKPGSFAGLKSCPFKATIYYEVFSKLRSCDI
jgi:hypothetical protein